MQKCFFLDDAYLSAFRGRLIDVEQRNRRQHHDRTFILLVAKSQCGVGSCASTLTAHVMRMREHAEGPRSKPLYFGLTHGEEESGEPNAEL